MSQTKGRIPYWATARPKKKTFAQRHGRAFSITGLAIVLMTFVVKDVFQDQLKELQDKMAEAQRAEEIDDQTYASSIDQLKVNMRLTELKNELKARQIGGPTPRSDLPEEVSQVSLALSNEGLHFGNISIALDMLPGNTEALKTRRDELRKKLNALGVEISDTGRQSLEAKAPSPANDILVLLGIIKIASFDFEVIPLQRAVEESAKQIKESAERRYNECTYIGWVLFVAGWILGIGGAIFGWETAAE